MFAHAAYLMYTSAMGRVLNQVWSSDLVEKNK